MNSSPVNSNHRCTQESSLFICTKGAAAGRLQKTPLYSKCTLYVLQPQKYSDNVRNNEDHLLFFFYMTPSQYHQRHYLSILYYMSMHSDYIWHNNVNICRYWGFFAYSLLHYIYTFFTTYSLFIILNFFYPSLHIKRCFLVCILFATVPTCFFPPQHSLLNHLISIHNSHLIMTLLTTYCFAKSTDTHFFFFFLFSLIVCMNTIS